MLDQLRSGAWLTEERLRRYPAILLVLLTIAAASLLATAQGDRDAFGRPLGTDFGEIWIAGLEVDQGHAAKPYDREAHFAAQAKHFGDRAGQYVWPYPPYFLAPAALLALLPYLAALLVWQAVTLALYLAGMFAILRPLQLPWRPISIAVLAFPAVFINLAHGQNGFSTAALLTGGLLLLDRRPLIAGLAFALLAYKPQFGLMIPFALVAAGRWRTIIIAASGIAAMTAASIAAFGMASWQGFFSGLHFTRAVILEQGALGYDKVQSVFAALRLLGGPVSLAYVAQAITAGGVIAGLVLIWRSRADGRLQAAALLTATLLATPYVLDYDMVVLAPALAFALSYGLDKGFGAWEKSGLALVWSVPLVARPLGGLGIPLGALVMLVFFIGLVLRAWRDVPREDRRSPDLNHNVVKLNDRVAAPD